MERDNTGQSKTGSLIEALANIAAGVIIAFLSQEIIFRYYGIPCPVSLNIKLTAWFTFISLARSFLLRRIFNAITTRYQ